MKNSLIKNKDQIQGFHIQSTKKEVSQIVNLFRIKMKKYLIDFKNMQLFIRIFRNTKLNKMF